MENGIKDSSAVPKLDYDRFYAANRQEWRDWLVQNHKSAPGVWLIFYKKSSGKASLSYDDAVEEALCFGWIDSRVNSLDNERYMQIFTPRKPESTWSKSNKERIKTLMQQGLMVTAGLEKIEEAKKSGWWTKLDAIEALEIPPDLDEALLANETARQNFMAFNDSTKKGILWWIVSAKRPATRAKRIEETVRSAAENSKPFQ